MAETLRKELIETETYEQDLVEKDDIKACPIE